MIKGDKDLKILDQIEMIEDLMGGTDNSFKKSYYADRIVDLRKKLVEIYGKSKGGMIRKKKSNTTKKKTRTGIKVRGTKFKGIF